MDRKFEFASFERTYRFKGNTKDDLVSWSSKDKDKASMLSKYLPC